MPSVVLHFHGMFKTFCPDPVRVIANTAAEAIDLVTRQIPGFRPNPTTGKRVIQVKGFQTVEKMFSPLEVEELHIWPAMHGGGGNSGAFIKIVIGVVLIAVAWWNPGGWVGVGMLASAMTSIGVSLVLGGMIELLSPSPKIDLKPSGQDPEASKYLGSGQNTVRIGTRIPILLGEHRVYGHFISFNIDAKDVNGSDSASGNQPAVVVPAGGVVLLDTMSDPMTITGPSNQVETAFYQITGIDEGIELYLVDGTTRVVNDTFITISQGGAGLRAKGSTAMTGDFQVQGFKTSTTINAVPPVALGSSTTVTLTIHDITLGGDGGDGGGGGG